MSLEYRYLGQTGLLVSRLCFGSLTMGPMQANLSVQTGGRLLEAAFAMGINFVDTAESYDNYGHIRWALERGWSHKVHVATKSYAVTAAEMEQSLERALRGLGRDYIDIFMLHEQESSLTLRGHGGALDYLVRAKERGLVRAVGMSTHHVAGVRAGALHPQIDVIHPLINRRGWGIVDGSVDDMLAAIRLAASLGKGLYGMKALAGGHLYQDPASAFRFVLALPELASIAVGMQNEAELRANLLHFSGQEVPSPLSQQLHRQQRRLRIADYCEGCGSCLEACPSQALSIVDGQAQVDADRCVLCGYCSRACPNFCLKVI
ncbi:MAG TPA: 4Fe-4S binding protein [Firmicutes bacterium]|jgi:predicted aldo/keto reductase-like oxidoreductase|nr:4Fe-4S binding protein [Bacillota bacterium]